MSDIVINTNVSNKMTTKYQNDIQDKRLTSLEEKFSTMCDNHAHDISDIRESIAGIKANVKILVWFMLAQIGAIISLWIK